MTAASPAKQEILARERRWAMAAAIAAMAGVVASVASGFISASAISADGDAARLVERAGESSTLLISACVSGLGLLLFVAPLAYLFLAARGRSPDVRASLGVLFAIGAVLLGANAVVTWSELDSAADQFVASGQSEGEGADDRAADARADAVAGLPTGLGIAGTIAFIVGVFYTALVAMRVGLLTRFWGSFGMATSVVFLLPALGFLLFVWFIHLGLLIAGWLPRGRPPAWAAAEPVPWPKPGEQAAAEMAPSIPPPPPDQRTVEGEGRKTEPPRKRKRRG